MSDGFDAFTLRKYLVESLSHLELNDALTFGDVMAGKYPTQPGNFQINSNSLIVSVCVWEGGVVEIYSLGLSGETKEIETVRESTLDQSVNAIKRHIRQFS